MSDNLSLNNKKRISFGNTEIAFRYKTDKDLNRAYWLFKLIGNDFLVGLAPRATDFAFKVGLPIESLIKKTVFKHFCGGESIEECEAVIETLAKGNVGSILDYSVEGEHTERAFSLTAEEIVKTIRRAKGDERIPFTVFKLTGIARYRLLEKVGQGAELSDAEHVEFFKVKARVNHICKTAFDLNVPLMIDAEESQIQNPIDELAIDMMRLYNREKAIIYNTYQLYRKDKLESLKQDCHRAESEGFILGAKLVRGAYLEKEREIARQSGLPSPIHETKEATDKDFDEALSFCAERIKYTAFVAATHNEASCILLIHLMEKLSIPRDHPHVYFAQLLGMSDNLSFNLGDSGYNGAKYVPYGPVKVVLPYLFRRAEENKSIAGQTGRELRLIAEEKKRRRNK